MASSRRVRFREAKKSAATFWPGRNVALEKAIKRDMPNASEAEVRFHALWPTSTPQLPGTQYWQVLRATVLEALSDHMSGKAVLPQDIAKYLHRVLFLVKQGELPELLIPRRSREGRGNRRTVATQDQIDAAIEYWVAVEMGRIQDTEPRKTLALAFDVSPRQVLRWLKETGNKARRHSRFNEHWSAFARYKRPQDVNRMVRKLMEFRAQEYRDARRMKRGRSSGAR